MIHRLATPLLIVVFSVSSLLARSADVVRVGVKEKLSAGPREVILTVYDQANGGIALARVRRSVLVDANGAITTPLDHLLRLAVSPGEKWLGVQVPPGGETPRVRLNAAGSPPAVVHIVTDAAISANGIVESVKDGFRFPDGSVQTSAATVSGGVPSVNSIGTAVTIAGAGTASVTTASSTITVTGTGLSGVTAGDGLTGGGTTGNPTISASFGNPVSVSTSNAQGVANTVARSDHAHAHGNQAGGSLHSNATTGTSGFMSASDKTKLDATVAYVRTIVVSPTPGNATASGTALLNALNGISGNSASNPYLLKIEPGVYDIGSTQLVMKQYVDIEGSGEKVTLINGSRGGSGVSTAASVVGALDSELRNLSISNTSPADQSVGVYVSGAGPFRLRNVTVNSSGVTFSHGLLGVSGAALYALDSTITSASGSGYARGISNNVGSGVIHAFNTTITASSTGAQAYGVYGSSNVYLFNTTVTSNPAASYVGYGIYVDSSASTISNSTIRVTGGSNATALFVSLNTSTTTVTVDGSTAVATGSSDNAYGVYVDLGTAIVTNSTLRAETATTRYAAYTSGSSGVLDVLHSRLLVGGTTASARRHVGTLRIALSQLDTATSGTPTCFNVYDASFAAMTCN